MKRLIVLVLLASLCAACGDVMAPSTSRPTLTPTATPVSICAPPPGFELAPLTGMPRVLLCP